MPVADDDLLINMRRVGSYLPFSSAKIYIGRQGDLLAIFYLTKGEEQLGEDELDTLVTLMRSAVEFIPLNHAECSEGLVWVGSAKCSDAFCRKLM